MQKDIFKLRWMMKYKVVVVVSAMGRKGDPYATDTLFSLINGSKSSISKRETDLLLSCGEIISSIVFTNMLLQEGIKATSLTGAQAGFCTNNDHTNAKIIEMNCERLLEELETNDVVVVAGFQGQRRMEILQRLVEAEVIHLQLHLEQL